MPGCLRSSGFTRQSYTGIYVCKITNGGTGSSPRSRPVIYYLMHTLTCSLNIPFIRANLVYNNRPGFIYNISVRGHYRFGYVGFHHLASICNGRYIPGQGQRRNLYISLAYPCYYSLQRIPFLIRNQYVVLYFNRQIRQLVSLLSFKFLISFFVKISQFVTYNFHYFHTGSLMGKLCESLNMLVLCFRIHVLETAGRGHVMPYFVNDIKTVVIVLPLRSSDGRLHLFYFQPRMSIHAEPLTPFVYFFNAKAISYFIEIIVA